MARGGDAPFQSFDTSGRRGDAQSTTPRTLPIERHFSRLGCGRVLPREEAADRNRTREEGGFRRGGAGANKYTGFDDTSTEGRTPHKTTTTTTYFENQTEWF